MRILVQSFGFLGFTNNFLTFTLKLNAKSQICCKGRESLASPINQAPALFAGEGFSKRSLELLDFLSFVGFLFADLHVVLVIFDILVLINLIELSLSSISSTLTLFLG